MTAGRVGPQLHVIMHGREVAILSSSGGGSISLTYADDADEVTRGLSCCLPVVGAQYAGQAVDNWISGLLPDRSEVVTRWRAQYGLKRQDAFALLWHVGEDVAGAARFIRPDRLGVRTDETGTEPLTDQALGARIKKLVADATAWGPSPGAGQFSLAGAQAKFALTRTDEGWVEPVGDRPTTHIFKPAIPGMADHDLNEHLTMRLAAAVGLPFAPTRLTEFDGQRVLVVTRFDRYQSPDGVWHRVHQEDAVQALGLSPRLKYEQHGGPGVRQLVQLLQRHVNVDERRADINTFIDAVAFNWLVVGTDAHARNYALMHHGGTTRLAPLFHLNSFLPYTRRDRATGLSMRIGFTERDPARVSARDWEELARDCHLDAEEVVGRVARMADRLIDVASEVIRTAAEPWKSPLPATMRRALLAHVRACKRRL